MILTNLQRAAFAALLSLTVLLFVALPEEAAAHNFLVVDTNRIKQESRAGKEISSTIEMLRASLRQEIMTREEVIREDEKRLAQERDTLTPEDFRARVSAFEQKVLAQRKFAEEQSRRLQFTIRRAQAQFERITRNLLAAIMQEAGAELLLESSQIVLASEEFNITDEVIERIDAAIPEGSFKVLETPASKAQE